MTAHKFSTLSFSLLQTMGGHWAVKVFAAKSNAIADLQCCTVIAHRAQGDVRPAAFNASNSAKYPPDQLAYHHHHL